MNCGLSACYFNKGAAAVTQHAAYIKLVHLHKNAFHFQIFVEAKSYSTISRFCYCQI